VDFARTLRRLRLQRYGSINEVWRAETRLILLLTGNIGRVGGIPRREVSERMNTERHLVERA
jgi:hypothetical protein